MTGRCPLAPMSMPDPTSRVVIRAGPIPRLVTSTLPLAPTFDTVVPLPTTTPILRPRLPRPLLRLPATTPLPTVLRPTLAGPLPRFLPRLVLAPGRLPIALRPPGGPTLAPVDRPVRRSQHDLLASHLLQQVRRVHHRTRQQARHPQHDRVHLPSKPIPLGLQAPGRRTPRPLRARDPTRQPMTHPDASPAELAAPKRPRSTASEPSSLLPTPRKPRPLPLSTGRRPR